MGEDVVTVAQPWTVVVMGVSGSGKSAVGVPTAQRSGAVFLEADDFHPRANVDKMSAGIALTDQDRWPWLDALVAAIRSEHERGHSVVLTCSALRRVYRDRLRAADPHMLFLHLSGDRAVIQQRMELREHFMPPALLESQIATLESLDDDEHHAAVNIDQPLASVIDDAIATMARFGLTGG